MSHDALRRLGVFFPGDKVIYVPDDPFSFDEHAVVLKVANDSGVSQDDGGAAASVRCESSIQTAES